MNVLTEKLNYFYVLEKDEILSEIFRSDSIKLESLLNEGMISNIVDKLKDSYHTNIELVKKILLDHGVNVDRIKAKSGVIASSVKDDLKNKRNPQKIQGDAIFKVRALLKTEVKSVSTAWKQESLSDKIITSLIIFILMYILSQFVWTIVVGIFGPTVGTSLLVIVLAPIIEETAKRYAIIYNVPWVYTGIFAGVELIGYVIKIVAAGGLLGPALILRAAALGMHFATTAVQKYFMDKGKEEIGGDEFSSQSYFGYFLGILIHVTWNLLSTVFNKEISTLAGL